MSTHAIQIRDRVFDLIQELGLFKEARKTTAWQRQPDKLPSVHVLFLREQRVPEGDLNVGEVRFISDIAIGVAVMEKGGSDVELETFIDNATAIIEATLYADQVLIGFSRDSLTEGVSAVSRNHVYPQQGETFYGEARLDITFRTRLSFEPEIVDDYRRTTLTTRPLGADQQTPAITTVIDISQ